MKSQKSDLPTYRFSVASIPKLTNTLTNTQKRILNEAWNQYVSFGKTIPLRSLHRIIENESFEETFKGFNGSLIYEIREQSTDYYFKLTGYGALLTDHGPDLAVLLIRLLDFVKGLCKSDSVIKEVDY